MGWARSTPGPSLRRERNSQIAQDIKNGRAKSFCNSHVTSQSVERPLEAPSCVQKRPATISFVVHAVDCGNLLPLVQRLLAAHTKFPSVVQNIIVIEDCADKALVSKLQTDFRRSPAVQFHTLKSAMPEYAAFNRGMELTTSEVAFFVRDDDMPGADVLWVAHFARLFANNPRLGMLTCLSLQ